jgi:hypothetical protein
VDGSVNFGEIHSNFKHCGNGPRTPGDYEAKEDIWRPAGIPLERADHSF